MLAFAETLPSVLCDVDLMVHCLPLARFGTWTDLCRQVEIYARVKGDVTIGLL
jgi:hypothetical protein